MHESSASLAARSEQRKRHRSWKRRVKSSQALADVPDMPPRPSAQLTADDKCISPAGSCFVARQPILNRDEKVFGYEILFRDGADNYFQSFDGDAASRNIVDRSLLIGFDTLCDGHKAFINCTRDTFLQEYITLLPRRRTVAEILETIEPDETLIASCHRLKASGYLIALDDFTMDDPRESLVALADIVKVDLRLSPVSELAALMARYKIPGRRLLAEKVETYEEFTAAAALGCSYFQGYFFRKPEMLAVTSVPPNHATHLLMMQAASNPELDLREIETLVKKDPALCYRLLRYLNSALFSLPSQIRSVRHALSMLGTQEMKRWMYLVALVSLSLNRPSDLMLSALVRARFGEVIADTLGYDESNFFLAGLLSLMDAILKIPMAQAIELIPLDPEIETVLLGNPSLRPLSVVHRLTLALELGDWQTVRELARQFQLTEHEVAEMYWQAMRWARVLTRLS